MDVTLLAVLLSVVFYCNGVSTREQLARIAKLQRELEGYDKTRRFGALDDSVILGAPSYPNHLPEAEPILPGHTLLRPAIGMLKSAVKFPHRDLDNGAGVYGNIKNLGLRYDGKNERVLYSGFRRSSDYAESVETDSDSSSDEEPSLRHRKEKSQQRNIIKKYIKIFPFETINKRETHPKELNHRIQNLKLYVTKGRLNRNVKRSVDTKLHTSPHTYKFAKLLIKKLKENERRKQQSTSLIILQPGLDQSYESNSFEEYQPKTHGNMLLEQLKTIPSEFTNDFQKKLPNRQRRQQNIVMLQSEAVGPKYTGGVDLSLENNTSLVTERPKNWFYKDKDAFNHIKISQDAPDQEDYFPKDDSEEKTDVRNWWYYHQADFIPFTENDI